MSTKRNDKKKKQMLKTRKMQLEKLKKEVLDLESQIKVCRKENFKKYNIRNLKIFGSICNFAAPFIFSAGITIGTVSVLGGGLPFTKDKITKYKHHLLEYKSNGIISSYENYQKSKKVSDSNLSIYYPLEKNEEGLYERNVREYSLEEVDIDELYEHILNNDYNYIIDNYNDYEEKKEVFDNADPDYDNYIIDSTINYVDKKDTIVLDETDADNFFTTFIDIGIPLTLGGLISLYRKFKLVRTINNIKYTYLIEKHNTKEMKKTLKEKKQKILSLEKGGKKNVR